MQIKDFILDLCFTNMKLEIPKGIQGFTLRKKWED